MEKKSDLRTFVIALLTSVIVLTLYHLGMNICKSYSCNKASCYPASCEMTKSCQMQGIPCRVYIVPQNGIPTCFSPKCCPGKYGSSKNRGF